LEASTPEIKGCVDIRVEEPADLRDALETVVAVDGPVVVEVISVIEIPTALSSKS
jgi:thiamine pyrophosphate-dependent acetolactate synthase large subunit-like protein